MSPAAARVRPPRLPRRPRTSRAISVAMRASSDRLTCQVSRSLAWVSRSSTTTAGLAAGAGARGRPQRTGWS